MIMPTLSLSRLAHRQIHLTCMIWNTFLCTSNGFEEPTSLICNQATINNLYFIYL